MNVLQRGGVVCLVAGSAVAMGAGLPDSGSLSTGERMVAQINQSVIIQVEYCLRNAPELSTELALSHATYSASARQAVELLNRRFPSSAVFDSSRIATAQDEGAAALQLKQAQSTGPRQCPGLVSFMHHSTGESLAKMWGDTFGSMLQRKAEESN